MTTRRPAPEPWTQYEERDSKGRVTGSAIGPGRAIDAVRMAQAAAAGMFWDGHRVVRAERLQNAIGIETACGQESEIPLPLDPEVERMRGKGPTKCGACIEAERPPL